MWSNTTILLILLNWVLCELSRHQVTFHLYGFVICEYAPTIVFIGFVCTGVPITTGMSMRVT